MSRVATFKSLSEQAQKQIGIGIQWFRRQYSESPAPYPGDQAYIDLVLETESAGLSLNDGITAANNIVTEELFIYFKHMRVGQSYTPKLKFVYK